MADLIVYMKGPDYGGQPPPTTPAADWQPTLIGNIWSWAWAGDGGENLTIVNKSGMDRITVMNDLSGNGNHYQNLTGAAEPYFEEGLSKNGYVTNYAPIGRDRLNDGTNLYNQWMTQSNTMSASGEFYLAMAGMNTRTGGIREIWGQDSSNHVSYDQGTNTIYANVNGSGLTRVTPTGDLPSDELLLEFWRDSSDDIHVWANGIDISRSPKINMSGNFDMGGIGYDGGGTSYMDDYTFEYVAVKGAITETEKALNREYLRAKWNLYSDPSELTTFILEEG